MKSLVAIPVYNEERHIPRVIAHVLEHAPDVLVIDDGSYDRTTALLPSLPVDVIRHSSNRGYGRSMRDAFLWAAAQDFDWVVTIDCDEQHEPAAIPSFLDLARSERFDVVSGSRYMPLPSGGPLPEPPEDRRRINRLITDELNSRLSLSLTDAFCGFKAYRVAAVRSLPLTEDGYAFPMQFWVQAVAAGLRITETPVKLIYNDPSRTFGGPLNDPETRLNYYQRVLRCELLRCARRLPPAAVAGISECCEPDSEPHRANASRGAAHP